MELFRLSRLVCVRPTRMPRLIPRQVCDNHPTTISVCACVRARPRVRARARTRACVCVCVCVCWGWAVAVMINNKHKTQHFYSAMSISQLAQSALQRKIYDIHMYLSNTNHFINQTVLKCSQQGPIQW